MVIFDCNGVLVDSEPLATAIVSQEFIRAGFALTPDIVARYFTGRRPADMFAEVEMAAGRKLPPDFAATVTAATLRRFRAELRATKHASYALSWLRGPKCVASSSSLDRIRVSLESTDLIRFFEPNLFSAGDVRNGAVWSAGYQPTAAEPVVVITLLTVIAPPAFTTTELRRHKGSPDMLRTLEQAVTTHVQVPADDLRVPLGARTLVLTRRARSIVTSG